MKKILTYGVSIFLLISPLSALASTITPTPPIDCSAPSGNITIGGGWDAGNFYIISFASTAQGNLYNGYDPVLHLAGAPATYSMTDFCNGLFGLVGGLKPAPGTSWHIAVIDDSIAPALSECTSGETYDVCLGNAPAELLAGIGIAIKNVAPPVPSPYKGFFSVASTSTLVLHSAEAIGANFTPVGALLAIPIAAPALFWVARAIFLLF
jgi:hypothetical protein